MKREKFSPNIESENNTSRLTLLRSGIGKKAAALLLTGSIATGAAACSDNEKVPSSDSETVSTSTYSSDSYEDSNLPLGGEITRHPHPELSSQGEKIAARYGDIEKYPTPVDYSFKNPTTGETITLNQTSEKTIDTINIMGQDGESYIDYVEIDAYVPQIEQYASRDNTVEVNGSSYDVGRMINDPTYRGLIIDSKTYEEAGMSRSEAIQKANATTAESLIALATHQGDIVAEYIKAEYVNNYESNAAYVGDKKYKTLDENADNQEILDNFDIEVGALTSLHGQSSKKKLSHAVMSDASPYHELDSEILSWSRNQDKGNPVYRHHKAESLYDTSENLDPRNIILHSSASRMDHVRIINAYDARNESSTPEALVFAYYEIGGIKKWVNLGDSQYDSGTWSRVREQYKEDAARNEIAEEIAGNLS